MTKLEEITQCVKEGGLIDDEDSQWLLEEVHRLRAEIEKVKEIDEKQAITETMEMASYAMSFVSAIKELYKALEGVQSSTKN